MTRTPARRFDSERTECPNASPVRRHEPLVAAHQSPSNPRVVVSIPMGPTPRCPRPPSVGGSGIDLAVSLGPRRDPLGTPRRERPRRTCGPGRLRAGDRSAARQAPQDHRGEPRLHPWRSRLRDLRGPRRPHARRIADGDVGALADLLAPANEVEPPSTPRSTGSARSDSPGARSPHAPAPAPRRQQRWGRTWSSPVPCRSRLRGRAQQLIPRPTRVCRRPSS